MSRLLKLESFYVNSTKILIRVILVFLAFLVVTGVTSESISFYERFQKRAYIRMFRMENPGFISYRYLTEASFIQIPQEETE